MARHMRNGRDYSRPGPKVDYELRQDSNNAARSGDVYNKIEEIQSQIVPTASIEIGETASKAYSKGDFLVKNGVLYKVTNAIAQGDALTVGTNIVMTTVGSELSSIKSFEEIATATKQGNVTTTKPLSKFNAFVFLLTIVSGSWTNIVLQTTFVTREIFEMEGTSLFVTNETGNYMGRIERVDDNTVNFFDFKNVKKAYLIGFY